MPKKPFLFRGKLYPSMTAAARENGLKPNTLHRANWAGRIHKAGQGSKGTKTPVFLNGRHFDSVQAAAKGLGVHRNSITRALNEGRTEVNWNRGKAVQINGRWFLSHSAVAKHYKISRHRVAYLAENNLLYSLHQPMQYCILCKTNPVPKNNFHCQECRR